MTVTPRARNAEVPAKCVNCDNGNIINVELTHVVKYFTGKTFMIKYLFVIIILVGKRCHHL